MRQLPLAIEHDKLLQEVRPIEKEISKIEQFLDLVNKCNFNICLSYCAQRQNNYCAQELIFEDKDLIIKVLKEKIENLETQREKIYVNSSINII